MLVAGTGKATPWRGPTLQYIQKLGSCHGMTLPFYISYLKPVWKNFSYKFARVTQIWLLWSCQSKCDV